MDPNDDQMRYATWHRHEMDRETIQKKKIMKDAQLELEKQIIKRVIFAIEREIEVYEYVVSEMKKFHARPLLHLPIQTLRDKISSLRGELDDYKERQ